VLVNRHQPKHKFNCIESIGKITYFLLNKVGWLLEKYDRGGYKDKYGRRVIREEK